MQYLIYKNKKTQTQSAYKKYDYWILEDTTFSNYNEDVLTGWKGQDISNRVYLKFKIKEEAVSYAIKHKLEFKVEEEKVKNIKEKSYSDNFKYKRIRSEI